MPNWWQRNVPGDDLEYPEYAEWPGRQGRQGDPNAGEAQRGARTTFPPQPQQRPQWSDEIVATLPLSVVVRSIPLPNGKRWYSIKIAELGPVAFGEGYSVAQAAASLQTRFSPVGINIEHLITAAISARRRSGGVLRGTESLSAGMLAGAQAAQAAQVAAQGGGSSAALGGPTDLSGKSGGASGGKPTKQPVLDISEMETGDLGMTS